MKHMFAIVFVLFGVTGVALAHDPQAPSTIEHFPLDQVSPHVYVVHGPLSLPNAGNRGFMNNPAAILTPHGVIIVDPGSSREIGRQLLDKVRKITDKPVIAVFNTHVHGDHWLGNHGIREVYPDVPIYAHERAIQRARQGEGDFWVANFMRLTNGAVKGTQAIAPNIGLKGGETLTLDGVTLHITHPGRAHSDNDLLIEVVDDRSLFCGDVVVAHHVPNSDVPQDASFKGSVAAIQAILKGPDRIFIPGHGRTGGHEVPETALQFLLRLNASVTRYFKQGLQDYEMKDRVIREMNEYRDWHNFSEMGRVISFAYQEVERDNF